MRSALPAPRPQPWAQSDLPRAAALPRPAVAGLPVGSRLRPETGWVARDLVVGASFHRITTAAPARARSAWLRAGYSARVEGGRCSRSLDLGGLGAGLLGDPFGTCVGDRLAGDRSLLWRRRLLCGRSRGRGWRRGACELVIGRVALLPEIPALTFGDAVDAIVPMAARGGRALRRGQAAICGGLGRWRGGFRCCCDDLGPEIRHRGQAGACHDTGKERRGEFHGTVRHTQPRQHNATRLLTPSIWSETWVAMSRNFGADGV